MNAGEMMGLFTEDVGHGKNTSASYLLSVKCPWEIDLGLLQGSGKPL